jgi:6-phosphogluconate dehydrogenase
MDYLLTKQLHFIGAGISGGEEGARKGPSIMPGGVKAAYDLVSPYLMAIAAKAKAKADRVCCAYIGPDGAGHFVKMVHNGIEYAEMQLIAECYGLLRYGAGYQPGEIAAMFDSWRKMSIGSYLLEITVQILNTKENEDWLIDKILDQAENKGTGSWTSIAAAQLGVPATMITAALFARYTSAFKKERVQNDKIYNLHEHRIQISIDHAVLKTAYKAARLINHHQGFQLIAAASEQYQWSLNLSDIARIWTNGCIIRSEMMEALVKILSVETQLLNHPSIVSEVSQSMGALAKIQQWSSVAQHPVPCFSAAQQFLFAWTAAQSTANLIQAQRDFFGAHRYQRTDDDSGKSHHTNWSAL